MSDGYSNVARALSMPMPGPRLHLVDPHKVELSDRSDNGVWRPVDMSDYIGQARAQLKMRMWVTAAIGQDILPGHILLTGAPGLGKTSMAAIVASMLDARLHTATGDSLRKPQQMARKFSQIREGDCLFIDEIHQMGLRSEEMLGLGMEDFQITIPGNAAGTSESVTMDIPKCVVIGATTRPAHLSRPLRDRFTLSVALEFYSITELSEIIRRHAARESVTITGDAIECLARVSRETPRKALGIFAMADAYARTVGAPVIDLDTARGALDVIGVDSLGLDERDRDYLSAIASRGGQRVGLAPLVAMTGLNAREITDDIEPYPTRIGVIDMAPRGRRLSRMAHEHLYPGIPMPPMYALP